MLSVESRVGLGVVDLVDSSPVLVFGSAVQLVEDSEVWTRLLHNS